jgi:hypothetical protein
MVILSCVKFGANKKTLFPMLHDSFVWDLALVLSCCAHFVLITSCVLKFYLLLGLHF